MGTQVWGRARGLWPARWLPLGVCLSRTVQSLISVFMGQLCPPRCKGTKRKNGNFNPSAVFPCFSYCLLFSGLSSLFVTLKGKFQHIPALAEGQSVCLTCFFSTFLHPGFLSTATFLAQSFGSYSSHFVCGLTQLQLLPLLKKLHSPSLLSCLSLLGRKQGLGWAIWGADVGCLSAPTSLHMRLLGSLGLAGGTSPPSLGLPNWSALSLSASKGFNSAWGLIDSRKE